MDFIPLNKLEIYALSRNISQGGWNIYVQLEENLKYSIGNQWIRAIDSIGANIAEGYGRYHFKHKTRFYYIARGSLSESRHWLGILLERDLISNKEYTHIHTQLVLLEKKLNTFIKKQKN